MNNSIEDYFIFIDLTQKYACKKCGLLPEHQEIYYMREHISLCFADQFKSKSYNDNESNHKILNEFTLTNNNLLKYNKKRKDDNENDFENKNEENNNKINKELYELLIEYYDELLKIKNNELDKLKENIKNGNLDLLDLLLQKQKELGNFEGRHKEIMNKETF